MHASPFPPHLMPHCFGSQRHTLAPPRMGISHQKFCQTNSDDPPRGTSANHALGSSSRNIKMAWVFPFVQGAPKHMVHPPETRPMSPHFKPPHCQTPPVIRAGSLIGHGRQRENSCFTALNQRVHGAPDSTRREIRTLNTCVTFVKYQMPQA